MTDDEARAPVTSLRSPGAPTPAPDARTSSAYLVDEAAAPVAEPGGVVRVERTTSLDGAAELLAEPRADVANVASLSALSRGPSDPLLELRPGDVVQSLAGLTPRAHAEVLDLARLLHIFERVATSPTTRRIYLNRLTLFVSWCEARGARAMPAHPEVLRLYLVSLAAEHKALSTLDVSVAAITMAHRALGHDPPMSDALRITLRSLRRTLGPHPTRSTSISLAMLRQIVAPCDRDPHGIRDRALILVTYFAGLRRAETAGLNREGAHREERDYLLTLGSAPRDRTDAPTALVAHAEQNLCPVLALDDWLGLRARWARGLELSPSSGPLFVAVRRGGRQRFHLGDRLAPSDVDRIVKRRAVDAGLNPAGLSAISLRAGSYAEAARSGASSTP